VVVRAAESKGFGRHVVVRHPGGYETVYAHLDRLDVAQGDEVRAGSTVGRAGSTGRSTGPHLHFEVRRSGQTVDPLEVLGRGRPDWRWPVAAASGASHDVG
jgi:murein DD-endopeptidase MepM/ murein hydrolase activator NlpD